MDWYLLVMKRYAQFTGRSRRKEYWMFALFNCIFAMVPYLIGLVMVMNHNNLGIAFLGISIIYDLAVIIPGLAVAVRRLHDIGRSGWWLLIGFVPFVGGIILLVFAVMDSQPGDNEYGPNPKAMASAAVIS